MVDDTHSTLEETHSTLEELQAGLGHILRAPKDEGTLEWIVRRPGEGEREVLDTATLDVVEGLVGDGWRARGSKRTEDGSAHPEMQIAIMGARAIGLIARERARWALAGDQLFVDLDLTADNLPPGTRLSVGSAVLEITPYPHRGCKKFHVRFGADAIAFLGSDEENALRLRGVYSKVVVPGTIRKGDAVRKMLVER